jgi:hypothetical protein
MKRSRTYKLQLSEEGIDLFLQCHWRLARLMREFIPYGVTLSVAVAVLEMQDACEIAAELEAPRCRQCVGAGIRFVGSSYGLVDACTRIVENLIEAQEIAAPPRMARLYVAALGALTSADDQQIRQALLLLDRT